MISSFFVTALRTFLICIRDLRIEQSKNTVIVTESKKDLQKMEEILDSTLTKQK